MIEKARAIAAFALKTDPAQLVFSAAPHPSAVTDVKLASGDDAQATVQVTADGKTGTISLVKEANGWKVDLSSLLQK